MHKKINWHEPTPHSKLAAIILLLAVVPIIAFYMGMQYEATVNTYESIDQTGAAVISENGAIQAEDSSSDNFVEIVPID